MPDPVKVMGDLEELAGRIDTSSKEMYRLEKEFEPIADQFDDVFNDLLTTLVDEYESSGKRLPGEDVRNALVTKQFREKEPILFGEYRRLKKEIDRGERRAKRIERAISSNQSILSFLKVEAQAVG